MICKMKLLFSGYHNPHYLTITEYIERAIQKTGNTLLSFDDRDFVLPGRIRKIFPPLGRWDLKRLNKKLISIVRKEKPDLCLITGGHRILSETIERIKKMGVKTVLWTIDPPIDFKPIIISAEHYDFVFCGGTEAMEILSKAGIKNVRWLPFACDPEIHKPVNLSQEEFKKYKTDIVFVGSYYSNRAKIFEALADFDFKIYGSGWSKLDRKSPLKSKVMDIKLKPEEWLKIYAASKIVVVAHYNDGKTPCYQVSPKVYETLACKKFLLVDGQRDLRYLFEDGRHLVIYEDRDDLRKKAEFYLKHSDKRKQIAEEGFREVKEKHTYLHRIKEVLKVLKNE